jgi:hypothetical protein
MALVTVAPLTTNPEDQDVPFQMRSDPEVVLGLPPQAASSPVAVQFVVEKHDTPEIDCHPLEENEDDHVPLESS